MVSIKTLSRDFSSGLLKKYAKKQSAIFLLHWVLLHLDTCFFSFWSDALERHEGYFVKLAIDLLSAYKVFIIFSEEYMYLKCHMKYEL